MVLIADEMHEFGKLLQPCPDCSQIRWGDLSHVGHRTSRYAHARASGKTSMGLERSNSKGLMRLMEGTHVGIQLGADTVELFQVVGLVLVSFVRKLQCPSQLSDNLFFVCFVAVAL